MHTRKENIISRPVTKEYPYWNDSVFYIGNNNTIHIFYTDTTLVFYKIHNGIIELISDTFYTLSSYFGFKSIDMDFDAKKELVSYSFSNMNGNQWCEIFDFSEHTNRIVRKGFLDGNFEMDSTDKSIRTFYGGSWYMDMVDSRLKWCGDTLLEFKVLIHRPHYDLYEHPELPDTLIYQLRKDCKSSLREAYFGLMDTALYNQYLEDL
ncbi:MAG: hypothetical protein GC181_12930 [Bacteroidetes bacterium]|nr:hypothetical protein [Bacteroidota bacterium]